MDNQYFDQNDQSETVDYDGMRPRRRDRSRMGSSGGWLGGAFLVALGLILMLQNLGTLPNANWWALFILLPAAGAFTKAFSIYQTTGSFTTQARGSLWAGLMFSVVAGMFLFDLNWVILGPVLLILAGAGLLINAVLPG